MDLGSGEGGMILETNNGNQVEACCMFSVSGFMGVFSGLLCGVACNYTMSHGYGQH